MRVDLLFLAIMVSISFQACTGCGANEDFVPAMYDDSVVSSIDTTKAVTQKIEPVPEPKADRTSGPPVTIKMKKQNGVYIIPMKINGIELDFIFDTGAGSISISDLEASLLYKQGKITQDDILGKGNFTDATGRISEGAIINLKEVSLSGRTIYNVQAGVVHNSEAPLLLGQTVLQRFGKITIDYENSEITFQ